MAYFMNADNVDYAVEILQDRAPEHYPYAKFLKDWKDTVNSNSDGWAYWGGGTRPAGKLAALVDQAMDAVRGFGGAQLPDVADMKKALRPIRAAATRHNLPRPELEEVPQRGYGMSP